MFDIACHFLRTNEQAFDFRIIGRGKVGARVSVDAQTRSGEQAERCFLQTSFGDAETQFHRRNSSSTARPAVPSGSSCVKQDFDPVWHTLPAPNTRTRSSSVSRSQSVHAAMTSSRLP